MSAQQCSEAATRAFFDAQRATTSCVSREHLRITAAAPGFAASRTIFLDPVTLYAAAGGPSGLSLKLRSIFAPESTEAGSHHPRWRIATRLYEYQILDYNLRELLVYHWQPGRDFAGPEHPHLHVSAALDAQVDALRQREIQLDKRHLVTGRVSLPAVVRMLITEFGVAPLRPAWGTILDRAETALRDLEVG